MKLTFRVLQKQEKIGEMTVIFISWVTIHLFRLFPKNKQDADTDLPCLLASGGIQINNLATQYLTESYISQHILAIRTSTSWYKILL